MQGEEKRARRGIECVFDCGQYNPDQDSISSRYHPRGSLHGDRSTGPRSATNVSAWFSGYISNFLNTFNSRWPVWQRREHSFPADFLIVGRAS